MFGRKVPVFFSYVEKMVDDFGLFGGFAKNRHLDGGQGKVDRAFWRGACRHCRGESRSHIFGVACLYFVGTLR